MAAAMTYYGLAGLVAGMTFHPTRFVLDKVLPAPEGPSGATPQCHPIPARGALPPSGRRLRNGCCQGRSRLRSDGGDAG